MGNFEVNKVVDNDGKEKEVRYYYEEKKKRKGMPGWIKAILIILAVIIGLVLLGKGCSSAINSSVETYLGDVRKTDVKAGDFQHDYIGVIHVETTISEQSESSLYNHKYILRSIDGMMKDNYNKGMILYLNTPGGSVYASDEIYFKIKEYKEKTKRPVYSSMQAMAASGGYYISAPCDRIFANRNCWTGSIGVTIGTLYDVTELLDNLGVKTQTITAGSNKAMGSYTESLTKEQRAIFQSLVDDAYDQFTEIVAEGRNLSIKKVKKLADGRVYTAKQALNNGLIDEIGTFDEAVEHMIAEYKLGSNCKVEDFISSDKVSLFPSLGIKIPDSLKGGMASDIDTIQTLMGMNNKFTISYEAPIEK